jgi:outer membrane protein insertion porin family
MRTLPAAYVLAALAFSGASVAAQTAPPPQACLVPDSLAVAGNSRVSRAAILADAGIARGDTINNAIHTSLYTNLYITANFERISTECRLVGAGPNRREVFVINVVERPVMADIRVVGVERLPERQVRDKLILIPGRVADPVEIARARTAVDSLYKSRSYYLARISVDTAVEAAGLNLTFRINEGRRLAISGITIEGNDNISDEDIVSAMGTKPEGFLWMKDGEFDDIVFDTDIADSIPALYASRGFIDMRVVHDTLIINPELGKAMIVIRVEEGPQYKVRNFEIVGNRYFDGASLQPLYPFRPRSASLTERISSVFGRERQAYDVFNQTAWIEATRELYTMYRNEGYRDAEIDPVIDRRTTEDSLHVVDLRWEINERSQSIINRINITGNTRTVESCIRQQLTFFPGSIYSDEKILQSMQRIGAMGFFEDFTGPPSVEPVNDSLGLLDVTFTLVEKNTGSVNFGASMGGAGGGLGGFIGFDQPNLFGKCKRGSFNWQFGSLINELTLSYSDPAFRKSNYSLLTDFYHLRARFVVADFGRQTRTGGHVRVGFPFMGSYYTRAYLSYGGERVKYSRDESSLLGTLATQCDNCFRSTVGANLTRDTRIGLPFPTDGVYQTVDAQFNGGVLGGSARFQRYTTELRSYVPLGTLGGDPFTGSQPIRLVFGFSTRAGFVFGNSGPFFPTQEFSMGGVQQGEPLRGYDEFTITPLGYVPEGSALQARRESFGKAYMSATAEVGARLSQMVYTSVFFDAGNVWRNPTDFNPTRLFRGAGVGVSLVTPLGPLGLDYAYGFDKLDQFGRPDPGWKLHFKLGQLF